jgi:DNA polymerase V
MPHSKYAIPIATHALQAGWSAYPALDIPRDAVDINEMVTGGRDDFLYARVNGGSAFPEIPDGSIVFIDPATEPRNGQAVVAYLNGQICVKRFERSPYKGLRLVSINADYEDRTVTQRDDFAILGVVRASLAFHS